MVVDTCRQWTSLRVLLVTTWKTLKDVADFSILLGLFVFIFSLLGMVLFANRLHFDPDTGVGVLLWSLSCIAASCGVVS